MKISDEKAAAPSVLGLKISKSVPPIYILSVVSLVFEAVAVSFKEKHFKTAGSVSFFRSD